ncbi:MAG: CIC family chloride channel protein, partial [Yoonia sp.]
MPASQSLSDIWTKWCNVTDLGLVTIKREGPTQIQFWFIALIVGIAAGFAALGFRLAVDWLQSALYQANDVSRLHSEATKLLWYHIVLIPACGGLIVGLILHYFTEDGRSRSVADVIEGAALKEGRVQVRRGFASAAASLVTLSSGGSTGREGPVVHMAAVLSTVVCRFIRADGITGR